MQRGIVMQEVMNATDVRKDWGNFIDQVVRFKPSVIKRNRDYLAAISIDHLELLLAPYHFSLEFEKEDDGSISGSLKEIDILANAEDIEGLKTKISQELTEYAEEYMNEFEKYFHAPNRKAHFPYILRVLIQKDIEEVRRLIHA